MRDLFEEPWKRNISQEKLQVVYIRRKNNKLAKIEQVREFLTTHLGAQIKDVVAAFGFSYKSSKDYMHIIRSEWRGKKNDDDA